MYTCKRCNHGTKLRTDMIKHLNKKKKCDRIINSYQYHDDDLYNLSLIKNNSIKKETNFYCKICNEYYSREDSLKRHNISKHKDINNNDIDNNDIHKNDIDNKNSDTNVNKNISYIINIDNKNILNYIKKQKNLKI
jgi:hypothetical protein